MVRRMETAKMTMESMQVRITKVTRIQNNFVYGRPVTLKAQLHRSNFGTKYFENASGFQYSNLIGRENVTGMQE